MEITEIPFAKYIGIEKEEEGGLKLEPADKVQNHMQTVHASAQFTLAETQSGFTLQKCFPALEGKVMAVLRSSSVKYKSPATTTIRASASIDEDAKEKFLNSFEKKGRASIVVQVKVLDDDNLLTMKGEFHWFVQKLN